MAACVPLLVAINGCSRGGGPSSMATPSDPPCETELCRTYEEGYLIGDTALSSGNRVTLSPAERAQIPVSDGSPAGAVDSDMAVIRIFCRQEVRTYVKDDPLAVNLPEYREAFFDGCIDGATPFLSEKTLRNKYDGTGAG